LEVVLTGGAGTQRSWMRRALHKALDASILRAFGRLLAGEPSARSHKDLMPSLLPLAANVSLTLQIALTKGRLRLSGRQYTFGANSTVRTTGVLMGEKGFLSDDAALVLLLEGSKSLARRRGVSLRTLRRQFAARGTTLANFVLSRRAALTVNLLQGKEITLRRAGQMLGFSNGSSFARFVRREFGQSPRDLHRDLQGAHEQEKRRAGAGSRSSARNDAPAASR
jgi:AraC-like DNA-binding protein